MSKTKNINGHSNSCTVSTRLNKDQKKIFENLASDKGFTPSLLFKHIIVEYLEEHKSNLDESNLIQKQLVSIKEKLSKIDSKEEWFQQLFFCWLENFFASHPKIEDPTKAIQIAKEARNRRNVFIETFNSDIYNDNQVLYDTLFANATEDKD